MPSLFRNIVIRIVFIAVFLVILVGVIAYARGYRYNFKNNNLLPTGIISLSAFPKASSIYINGALMGVTDMNITLPPGKYKIEVKKEGYTSWTKQINLKGELVVTLDILLFPANPSLSPVTNLGVNRAIPVGLSDKIILASETGNALKDGLYLFEPVGNPLSFLPPVKLLLLKSTLPVGVDITTASWYFSPDYNQTIADFGSVAYLLNFNEDNKNPFDVTASKTALIEAWNLQKRQEQQKILETYPPDFAKIASDSFHIVAFSPDETKALYTSKGKVNLGPQITPPIIASDQTPEERQIKPNTVYVYDRKEDKNFAIPMPSSRDFLKNDNLDGSVAWYTDSRHLIINEGKRITIVDYDGENKQTIYSGPYDSSFFKTTTDGKLIIMTNFNPEANQLPDLYTVSIR